MDLEDIVCIQYTHKRKLNETTGMLRDGEVSKSFHYLNADNLVYSFSSQQNLPYNNIKIYEEMLVSL